jgi:hypothetical protein
VDLPLARGLAVVAALLLLRHFAARRLSPGEGQFIVFWFLPTLLVGFVLVGTGIQMLPASPPAGVVVTVTGSVYLALLIGFLMRMSRSVSSVGPGDDLGAALAQPVGEYLTSLMGLVLIGGFAGLVGLLVWAASQAAR